MAGGQWICPTSHVILIPLLRVAVSTVARFIMAFFTLVAWFADSRLRVCHENYILY